MANHNSRNRAVTVEIIVPTISMFYGIIIRMYMLDTKPHHLPHIHVEYAEFEAVFQIPDGQLLEGDLPAKQYKLVEAGSPCMRMS